MKNLKEYPHQNKVVEYLNKAPEEITKKDLINFVLNNGIQMINFRFVGSDCRLKTLNFILTSKKQLDLLLSKGERVDGSSLFPYKVITGYLSLAPSLTAFGNTVPISYLRLVTHQEAPTNICWGERDRSVLVRIPLGWNCKKA